MSPRQRNTDAVWVDVIPSMVGFGADLAKEAAGAGTRAGTAVAVELEQVAEQAGREAGRRLGSGIAAAQARVDQLGAALRDARDREADAAGKVRIAEQKLNEVRAKGEKASGSQIAAAEEALAKARRGNASATDSVTRAAKALERAEQAAAEATDDAAEATVQGGRGLGDYAGQLGGAAKAAAGFAVAAAGVSSAVDLIGQAVDNTDVNAVLSAQLGATPQMAAEFGQIAGDLYARNYGDSLQAVSEGLRAVYQSGALAEDATSDQLDRITGRALNLQKTFAVDVTESMRSVGVLMRTGLAPNAEFALDLVTSGFQNGLNVAGDFLETINEYSTQFRKLGLDGQTSIGLIRQGLRAGARDTDVVADAIKEFSIRAIDGSTTTSAAYKTLGLDATATAQQIARGGEGASAGLQLVLDRLRGITDPVLQAQAAVGLFGTKAEDLGAALYALNPQTAVDALGNVEGAAQRMGDTLAGSPAANLQSFGRELQTWAVDLLGGEVVPILQSAVGWLRDDFGPALMASGQWIQRNREWLEPLVIVLGTYAVAYKAVAIAQTLWAQKAAIATAAQWAWNTAMSANPIGLIIAGIVALVAGFVYLWNNSEAFRGFWIGLWDSIKTAAVWVWNSVLKPAFDGIVVAVTAVGGAALWLWRNALEPTFDAVSFAARFAAAVLITVFVTPAVLAFKLLAAIGMWLWNNALQPAFQGIAAAAAWLWFNGIKPTVDGIAAGATWLYQNVIVPVVDGVIWYFNLWITAGQMLWAAVWDILGKIGTFFGQVGDRIGSILGGVIDFAGRVGTAFGELYDRYVQPKINAVGDILRWVYDNTVVRVFEGMRSGVTTVGSAFDSAVGWISRTWDSLKGKLADPANFLINFVYNDGIRAVWNKVAGFVGVAELPRAEPVRFAGGGFVVPGYAPGVDTVPSLLSRGEAVLVPELVREIGPRNIMAANYAASGRRGTVTGGGRGGGVARFAGGGVVGSLLDWVSGVGDNVLNLWKDPIATIKARIGSSGWADVLARGPARLIAQGAEFLWSKIKTFFGFSSDAAARAAGAAGGSPMGWQQMWSIVSAQFPAATLNSALRPGDPGYHGKGRAVDLGGPMDAINRWIAQVYPNSTQLIYTPGANILNGRPFTYDAPTRADHFDHVHWAFDQGGWLPPGEGSVFNGTGKPEAVLTNEQWASIGQLVDDRRKPVSVVQNIDARGADAHSVITTSENRLLHALAR